MRSVSVPALITFTAAVALHLGVAAPLSGQLLRGQVVDARTDAPIPGATIIVRTPNDSIVSQVRSREDGLFALALPGPLNERLFLEVSALGYSGSHEEGIQLHGEPLYLVIRLDPAPLETEELRVSVEAQKPFLRSHGYYHRRKVGHGRFMSPAQLERIFASRSSDFFRRLAGVVVRNGEPRVGRGQISLSRECLPAVYQDGHKLRDALSRAQFNDIVAPPEWIEAIEVYSGPATAPAAWRGDAVCGLIVVWTRR